MRNCSEDYAAVCGIAVKTMRQYADRLMTSMRQYADRAVTHTRHPAVFAVCIQRDELILPATRIGRTK